MASVRDSAEVKLIGFEQGVSVKTKEQLLSQTRARFHPLANPTISITNKVDKNATATLRVKNIPADPGDGNYTLHLQSHKGSAYDLKIRTVGQTTATSVVTVNTGATVSNLNNLTIQLTDFYKPNAITTYITFTFSSSSTRIIRNSSTSWSIGLNGVTGDAAAVRAGIAERIYNAIYKAQLDGELDITPVLDGQTVKLTQDNAGTRGNAKPGGSALLTPSASSSYISIPNFTGGTLGLSRTLNIGNLRHPKDDTAVALGLLDPPGYYVEENVGVGAPYADIINTDAQKIKRLTFDLNRIINYNSRSLSAGTILQYKQNPADAQKITLVSTDGTSRIYEIDTGNGVSGDNIAVTLGATPNDTYANLKSAIESPAGHSGKITVFHNIGAPYPSDGGSYGEWDIGEIHLTQLSGGTGGNRAITHDLTGLYYSPAFSGGVDGTGITSKIILDDTLFLVQDHRDRPISAGSFVSGIKYEILAVGNTNFKSIGSSLNLVGTSFTATGPGTGTGTARVHLDSAIGKKAKQVGLDSSGAAQQEIIFGLENWKLVSKDSDDFLFHDLPTAHRQWDSSKRSTKVLLNFPDLPNLRTSIKRLFMTIEYTLFNANVPTEPTNNPETISRIKFYINNGIDNDKKFAIVYNSKERVTEVLVNPYSTSFAQLASNYREDNFVFCLQSALNTLTDNAPFKFELKEKLAANYEYFIEITEKGLKTTYFSAFCEQNLSALTNNSFMGFFRDKDSFLEGFEEILIRDGDGSQSIPAKTISLMPDSALYSPKLDEAWTELQNKKVYRVGLKEVSSISDIKDRIFDTIWLANSEGNVDITPSMSVATARITVQDSHLAHGTSALSDSITIKSASGVQKKYTIVRGGSGGTSAIATGEVIVEGSAAYAGHTVGSGHASIGSIAVNVKNAFTRRDVLRELILAINSKNGHNGGIPNSVINVGEINKTGDDNTKTQRIYLKQVVAGSGGNETITKTAMSLYAIEGFSGADDYVSRNSIKLTTSLARGYPFMLTRNKVNIPNDVLVSRNMYTLDDFSAPVFSIDLRDGADNNSYYIKPNHDVEVRSFGFGKKTNDLRVFDDLSMNGPRLHSGDYPKTLDIDPVFYLTASPEVRFPIQVNNLGNVLGFEYDGVIEPLGLRELMLGRLVAESPMRGLSAEMGGNYSFSSIRKEAALIHNNITFEEAKNVAFFDNCPSISEVIKGEGYTTYSFRDPAVSSAANNVFYARIPGIIFKNEAKIQPYIDTEERVFQANPLNGNNPETNEMDMLVLHVQELNHKDDRNLGAENFRHRAGFDFSSSPHPGTDSIAFGGLRYV
tara:strand:- start:22561 stop:26487 length:3927 start_codon:yes stop_codon:yes gene_type:complete